MNLLFASSEMYPYSKSGGLADVACSLPRELKKYIDVYKITPLYSFIDVKKYKISLYKSFYILLGQKRYKITLFKNKDTIFVYHKILCDRKKMYGYKNDYLRFALFCMAIAETAKILKVNTLHLNDWHTALCALWLKEQKNPAKIIFTIHNLAYQGIFDKQVLSKIGISPKYFNLENLEFYDKVNFLKAGIAFSDILTTVSPTYAKEIRTKEYGCGLDGFLKKHSYKLYGVLNGIDISFFNPLRDNFIKYNFDRNSFAKKTDNKKEFVANTKKPFFIFIGRLVEQKGISLIIKNLSEFSKLEAEFIFLGEGDKQNEKLLYESCKKYNNINYIKGYDEKLSHRLYAGADFLLMPSLFEPCGLNQMIASRYGTVCIAHQTGGLKDTVFENEKRCSMGFVFCKYEKKEFLEAVKRAIKLYEDKKYFEKICKFNMECDFSFEKSAKEYLKLYE